MRRFTLLFAIAVVVSLVGLPVTSLLFADGGAPPPVPPALFADGGAPPPVPPALTVA
jgi:hypothetical protein